jgi:allose kinase
MNNTAAILGMDIGGTNVRSGFIDPGNGLHHFEERKTAEFFKDDSINNLLDYIALLLEGHTERPAGISIGVPSTVDKKNRIVYSTPNIKGLNNIDLASCIEERFNIPAFVSRDVCLLLLYDIDSNRLAKVGFILGFYIGTGIGNAISYNGDILTGRNGVAGELGHIPVLGKTDSCGCGSKGCIELYASGKYAAQLRDEYFPGENMADFFIKHGDLPMVETLVDNIGAAIATEITILDPEVVVLGGGVILQNGFPRQKLEAAIKAYARKPFPSENIRFIYAKESHESGVIGAGIFGFQKLSEYKGR